MIGPREQQEKVQQGFHVDFTEQDNNVSDRVEFTEQKKMVSI